MARLKKRRDFGRVVKYGKTFGDKNLIVFISPGSVGETGPRLGFAAARMAGSAVRRNRIRRRLRALMAEPRFADIAWPGDAVILGKVHVLEASWQELLRSMERLAAKMAKYYGALGKESDA